MKSYIIILIILIIFISSLLFIKSTQLGSLHIPITTSVPSQVPMMTSVPSQIPVMTSVPFQTPSITTSAPVKIDCQLNDWSEWSECDPITGTKTRTTTIKQYPKNGGIECPALIESQNCKVDCKINEWLEWSECDHVTGTKTRTTTIKQYPKNGGIECPPLIESQNCKVDCKINDWSEWSECDLKFKKYKYPIIEYESKNGGVECPSSIEESCCLPNGQISLDSNGNNICKCNFGWKGKYCQYNDANLCTFFNSTYGYTGISTSLGTCFCKKDMYNWKGNKCQYSDIINCGDGKLAYGVASSVDGKCTCNIGYKGNKCQYTNKLCNYNGEVDDNGKCTCDINHNGDYCQCNIFFNGANCEYFNDIMFVGQNGVTSSHIFLFKKDGTFMFLTTYMIYFNILHYLNQVDINTVTLDFIKKNQYMYDPYSALINGRYKYDKVANSIIIENYGENITSAIQIFNIYDIKIQNNIITGFKFKMGNLNNIISPDLQFIPIIYNNTNNVKSYLQPEIGQFIIGNTIYNKGLFGYFRYFYNKTGLYPSSLGISKTESIEAVGIQTKELTLVEIEDKKKIGVPVIFDIL